MNQYYLHWYKQANFINIIKLKKQVKYDTILLCQKEQFEAHQVLLTKYSCYLKNILMNINNSKYQITLNNINPMIMKEILNFMYKKKIALTKTMLLPFFKIVRTLEIKDLYINNLIIQIEQKKILFYPQEEINNIYLFYERYKNNLNIIDYIYQIEIRTPDLTKVICKKKPDFYEKINKFYYKCKLCKKIIKFIYIHHYVHFPKFFKCQICNALYKQNISLKLHYKKKHNIN